MNTYEDDRNPDEIASDVERTRADLSQTIDAIQSKLTPGQMMDQVFNYARTSLPADFGSNLGNAVRNNPLPVALVGIGIAWLAASGQNPRYSTRRAGSYEGDYASASGTEMEGGDSEAEGRMHKTASRVGETGQRIAGKASELGQRISEKTSALTGRARDASSRMHESAGSARARMGELSHRSQERYYRTRDNFSRMVDEQPLMLGVLGMALGAALGAAFPATRREDELMGRTRDDMLERAKETGRQQTETVKESARHVADTAKQEADRVANQTASSAQGDGSAGAPSTVVPGGGQERPSIH